MSLIESLQLQTSFAPVISTEKPFRALDFTASNPDLDTLDLTDTAIFDTYVFSNLLQNSHFVGIGGYNEPRVIYRRSPHFGAPDQEPRFVHLGVDLWAAAGTPVYAPLAAVVHSVANNDNFGDYGPTLILKHELNGHTFFSLYGHLSVASLQMVHEGQEIEAGSCVAHIGNYPENGHWPPHLHFQLIQDLGGYQSDYPGVASLSNRERMLANCPDPNLILRIAECPSSI
ncbi:peptidoglycan DD-metalloendopeptidase family protein [Arundinibacter roseus]|uniref:Peptidase M23 n=1 Tax=Arundinibacter roseus TaxID=2070510 RepID=A0A4R4KH00_9BACT|nr:peptidoglycan DD-metalloendopeptidase family protein [Arundinibacter roseus]TDB65829.1 peptidase M23 [Arundinibacter roseus]